MKSFLLSVCSPLWQNLVTIIVLSALSVALFVSVCSGRCRHARLPLALVPPLLAALVCAAGLFCSVALSAEGLCLAALLTPVCRKVSLDGWRRTFVLAWSAVSSVPVCVLAFFCEKQAVSAAFSCLVLVPFIVMNASRTPVPALPLPEDITETEEDSMLRALYERIIEIIERDKLYLDQGLTVSDLARLLYTNRLYVGRAISQCAKVNYCTLINNYRVAHSMELFRKNPLLRVNQMAVMSGFRTVSSFSVAFKYKTRKTPSAWCDEFRQSQRK